MLAALEHAWVLPECFLARIPCDGLECRIYVLDDALAVCDDDDFRGVMDGCGQSLAIDLRLLALCDHVEQGYEMIFARAIYGNGEPVVQCLHISFEPLGSAGHGHATVNFKQLRVCLPDIRDQFGDFFSYDVLQPR